MSMTARCALVSLFWLAAAIVVAAAHITLDRRSVAASAAAAIGAIVAAAYAYTRFCAHGSNIVDALAVGIAWLSIAIVAELVISAGVGHGWYALIGTPEHPLLRNVFMFVWIFAPMLCARRAEAR
jgi:hypothetical protein